MELEAWADSDGHESDLMKVRCRGRVRLGRSLMYLRQVLFDDASELMDVLGYAKYSVLGEASFGTRIALSLAIARPDYVRPPFGLHMDTILNLFFIQGYEGRPQQSR